VGSRTSWGAAPTIARLQRRHDGGPRITPDNFKLEAIKSVYLSCGRLNFLHHYRVLLVDRIALLFINKPAAYRYRPHIYEGSRVLPILVGGTPFSFFSGPDRIGIVASSRHTQSIKHELTLN
jgi:hypothetical protein